MAGVPSAQSSVHFTVALALKFFRLSSLSALSWLFHTVSQTLSRSLSESKRVFAQLELNITLSYSVPSFPPYFDHQGQNSACRDLAILSSAPPSPLLFFCFFFFLTLFLFSFLHFALLLSLYILHAHTEHEYDLFAPSMSQLCKSCKAILLQKRAVIKSASLHATLEEHTRDCLPWMKLDLNITSFIVFFISKSYTVFFITICQLLVHMPVNRCDTYVYTGRKQGPGQLQVS